MRAILLLTGLLFASIASYGQDQLTIASFLSAANQDEFVSFQRQKLYYFNSLSFNLPYIEKLEFRTETNEFDLRKQEYLVRVTPNSSRNIKTQRQYQQSIQHMTEMELETAFNASLKERYDLLVSYIYLQNILLSKKKQKILLNDKVTLLNRSMSLVDFDVLELIEVTYDEQENNRNILSLENSILTLEKTILELENTDKAIVVNAEALPGIDDIKNIIGDIDSSKPTKHPELEVRSAQLYNVMLEYEMEAAKTKFSIGYVQAQYGYDDNDPFRSNFSIGVGFDIPLKRSSQIDLNKLRIDILESQTQFKALANDLSKESFSLGQKLNNQIKKYDLVASQLEEGQAEFALQEYQKIAETPPGALLKLREKTLELEQLLFELEYEIVLSYIDYLNLTGLLSGKPLRNYLSKDLEVINP